MSVVLYANNLLESSAVTSITTTAMLAAQPKTRLYDRDRGAQGKASAAGQFDIDIVFSPTQTATTLVLVNHNATAAVTVYADTASAIGTTLKATLAPSGIDPFVGTWASVSGTKWRIRFANFGSALAIGEVMLLVPRTLALNPALAHGEYATSGNTFRDTTRAGYAWGVRRGVARTRLPYDWEAMPAADLAELRAAFTEANEGAKNLLVQDTEAVRRWMACDFDRLEPVFNGGAAGYKVSAPFIEAL